MCVQDQMVSTLKQVLGRHLFVPEPDQLIRDGKWLSPEELKHKVIVRMKVKPGEWLSPLRGPARCCSVAGLVVPVT